MPIKSIDLIGEPRSVDLDKRVFTLLVNKKKKIEGKFSSEQEPTIINALRNHANNIIRIIGKAEYSSDGKILRIIKIRELTLRKSNKTKHNPKTKPIWKIAEEIGASIPDEEWKKIPADLSKNLDHYLHGAPKEK